LTTPTVTACAHTTTSSVAALIVAATAVNAAVYPVLYGHVVAATWTGCALMVFRNGLLGAAAVPSLTRLWRSTRTRADASPPSEPVPAAHRLPEQALTTPAP
jgi:hypothetical protein